ncbi:organic hydroperoxide resistance protein [Methylobrevis pamukkalensis]|nr:organic hydroperoxide resistance protein [Methylobrevis pamukkalensis]
MVPATEPTRSSEPIADRETSHDDQETLQHQATATGGRSGSAKSEDGVLEVTLTVPKEMGGDGARGTNPEQLFAAGYSGCFLGAMKAVASKHGVKIPDDATVTATVAFGKREDGPGFNIAVDLEAHVPGIELEKANEVVEAAHQVCPYSNATRGNIEITVKAV